MQPIYQINNSDLNSFFEERLKELRENIYGKYANTLINSNAVCQILNISSRTLYRYVEKGLLIPVKSQKDTQSYNLADVLQFNKKQTI